ncbi:MAG: hypothetical protein D5S00_10375 [Tindallia sp. MSAO_Bac2]|nr:MAG: hypothetical protein D5S00_10375 [Tindallia sp. MSAO_Bac2]
MNGKTGSSTVRRSLGALLKGELALKPIPRNMTDYSKRRLSFFRFDDESEDKLTRWMKRNLSIAFHVYLGNKGELALLETELIKATILSLNIINNQEYLYIDHLKSIRKECAAFARSNMI